VTLERRARWTAAAALCLVIAVPAKPAAAGTGEDAEAIRSLLASVVAANNAGDLEAISALYADDSIVIPPGEAPVEGRTAILVRYAKVFAENTIDLVLTSEETVVAGQWAFARGRKGGTTTPKAGGKPRLIDDKYVLILRRGEDGAWKIFRLIWNRMDEKP